MRNNAFTFQTAFLNIKDKFLNAEVNSTFNVRYLKNIQCLP